MKTPFFKSIYFLTIVFIVLFAIAVWMSFYFASFNRHQHVYNVLTPQERAELIQLSSSPNGKDTLVGKQRQAVIMESSAGSASSSLTQVQEQSLINAMSGK